MSAPMKWWIKERNNPQTGTYYVREGRLSKRAAARMENTIYGSNRMLSFDTEAECAAEFDRLTSSAIDSADRMAKAAQEENE